MNALPNFNQQISDSKGITTRAWYQFLQQLWKGAPPSSEVAVPVYASPFTYSAAQRGFLIVNGGTVSMVQWSRDGKTNYVTGQTQGCFPLSSGDALVIVFSATPTLVFVPQ